MARLCKQKYAVLRTVRDPGGKALRGPGGRPVREKVLDEQGHPVYEESDKWYGEFADLNGRTCRVALTTDKKVSAKALDKLVDALDKARSHVPVKPEEVPPLVRDDFYKALRSAGHSGAQAESGHKPLSEHLSDWKTSLIAKGNTEKHAVLVVSRARRAFEACRFTYWSDLSASKLESWLAEQRQPGAGRGESGLSVQTTNHYLAATKAFAAWMVRDSRVSENPLIHLQGGNVKLDRRHDRRAFTPDELRWLLSSTTAAPRRCGMTGAERAMLYRLSVETGLRSSEIRTLAPEVFDLDGTPPTVTVRAAYSKRRREDVQPLPDGLATELRTFLADHDSGDPVFRMPDRSNVVRMLRKDLTDARMEWLEDAKTPKERAEQKRSDFLVYRDASGRALDFHSFRHTFVTNLARAGVHPKHAMDLARHSDVNLTLARYSHTLMTDRAEALKALPDLTDEGRRQDRMRATGTDAAAARLPTSLPKSSTEQCRSVPPSAASARSAPQAESAVCGPETPFSGGPKGSAANAPGRTRTCDLRFRKPSLYPG